MKLAPPLTVLLLTTTRSVWAQDLDAQQVRGLSAHGSVTVSTPGAVVDRAAVVGEVLDAGTRVRTDDTASVRLELPNGTTLSLLPAGSLMLFAGPPSREGSAAPSTTTTLELGTVRVTPSREGASVMPLAIGGTTVSLGRSNASLSATRGAPFARVAVHTGRMVVRTQGRSRPLVAGEGARVRPGAARLTVGSIAAAPSWRQVPSGEIGSARGVVPVIASFAHPAVAGVTGWRVELARDAMFHTLLATDVLPPRLLQWEHRVEGAGAYYLRVRAIDALGLEGHASNVAHFTVATPEVVQGASATETTSARPTMLRVPRGVLCGIDGAAPTAWREPMRIRPGRPHQIRCVSHTNPNDTADLSLNLSDAGPIQHHVRARLTTTQEAVLGLQLADLEGNPLPYATVEAQSDDGVMIDAVREDQRRGSYVTRVRWNGRRERITLHFTVNGSLRFSEEIAVTHTPQG